MAARKIAVALAPLVVAKTEDGSHVYIYQGQPVPSSVGADELKRLKAEKFVGLIESGEEEPEAGDAGSGAA